MKKFITLIAIALLLIAGINSCKENKTAEAEKEVATAELMAADYKVGTAKSIVIWAGKKLTRSHMGAISLSMGFVPAMNKDIQVGTFVIDILSYL